jgi:HEAT repeat protein
MIAMTNSSRPDPTQLEKPEGASSLLPVDFFDRDDKARREWLDSLRPAPVLDDVTDVKSAISAVVNQKPADERYAATLLFLFENDPAKIVQHAAIRQLGHMESPVALRALLAALDSDDVVSVEHAILGVQRLKAREAVPKLISMLDDKRHHDGFAIRLEAAEALVAIRDERALEPMRAAAKRGWPLSRMKMRDLAEVLAKRLGYS